MRKLIVILLLLLPTLTSHGQNFTPVEMLIPKFQSPKTEPEIGSRTASILGFQIWRTYTATTSGTSSFDNANILYNTESSPTTYAEVETIAKAQRKKPNLVLWGRASRYGNGIVVESNLIIRKGVGNARLGTNIWRVRISGSHSITVDIPAWQYEFAPIIVDPALLLKEANLNPLHPGADIYLLKSTSSPVIGTLRASIVRAIIHEGDWSKVRIEGTNEVGWIYLPKLSQNPSEVVNFCGGLIRIFRGDWTGAVAKFQEVLKTGKLPTAVKIDSYLYMAIAYDKLRDDAKTFSMVTEAYQLDPYSKITTQYLYMSYLARLSRVLRQGEQQEEAKRITQSMQNLLLKNKVLFEKDDPWFMLAEQILLNLNAS